MLPVGSAVAVWRVGVGGLDVVPQSVCDPALGDLLLTSMHLA